MGEVAEQPMVLKEEHLSKPYQLYLLRILTGTLTEHEIKLHSTMQWIPVAAPGCWHCQNYMVEEVRINPYAQFMNNIFAYSLCMPL